MKKLIFIIILFFQACATNQVVFHQTTWLLHEMRNFSSKNTKNIKINFNFQKNQFFGSDSCNNIFGNFNINENKIIFNNISSTRMACVDMQTPKHYISSLKLVKSYKIQHSFLYFYNKDNQLILTFKQTN